MFWPLRNTFISTKKKFHFNFVLSPTIYLSNSSWFFISSTFHSIQKHCMLWLIFASFRKFFFTFLAKQWQLVHWDLYIHHIEWDRIQLAKSLSFVGKSHFMTIVVLVGNNMAAAAEPLWNTLRKGRKLEISRAWTFDENVNVFTMNWRKSKMKSFEKTDFRVGSNITNRMNTYNTTESLCDTLHQQLF